MMDIGYTTDLLHVFIENMAISDNKKLSSLTQKAGDRMVNKRDLL